MKEYNNKEGREHPVTTDESKGNLSQSESLSQSVIEAATDFGIITLDEQGVITGWNSGAEHLFGYSKNEIIGKNTSLLFTPEDRYAGIPETEIQKAKETGRAADERWHLHKNGSRFFVSGVMTQVNEKIPGMLVKFARNITDRKLAEEALLISEHRKSLAIQSAEMGEWELDLKNKLVKISKQITLLLGTLMTDPEIPLTKLTELLHPDDNLMVRERVDAALSGLNIFQAECRIIRNDDRQIRWVNLYGRVVAHTDGYPSKLIGVMFDITPRKLLEKQKDDFISMASHELKTPVTAIKSYSELLKDKLAELKAGDDIELLSKLNAQVDRLVLLMQKLLDTSSLEEGRLTLQPEMFDLNVLLADNRQVLHSIARQHQLEWQLSPVSLVHADKYRILQVVINFVENAVKYSPVDSKIIIHVTDHGSEAVVTVNDRGMGIPQTEQQFVFERYFRGEHAGIDKGFGLGLHICAQIIKQHNGAIGLSSSPDEGSSFYFTLPYS